MLDPIYCGDGMLEDNEELAIQYVIDYPIHSERANSDEEMDQLRQEISSFLETWRQQNANRTNRYAAVVKDKNPRQWWNINGHRFPNLAHLAKVVFNFPTSSASTERSFSANSFIHSKLRNRMCEETSNKLTYIKLNVDKAIPKDIHGRPLYQFNIGDSDDDDSM